MNKTNPGLYRAVDIMDLEPGTDEAVTACQIIVQQSADINLIVSLALDAATPEIDNGTFLDDMAETISRLCFECWNDLTTASNLLN